MTISSPRTNFPTGWRTSSLERRIALARASLGLERLLPALWPGLGFIGLYLSAALFNLFHFIPWPLQSLLLAATVTATALTLYLSLRHFIWPGHSEGARRLERDSGLQHRPITERDDTLNDARDPFTLALWQAHRARMATLGPLRVGIPRTEIGARDPRGLRWFLVALLVAGIVFARNDIGGRLVRAFDSGVAAGIDAWIVPPGYAGLPLTPVMLTDRDVAIPAGSTLSLRVHGAPHAPGLAAGANRAQVFHGSDGDYASDTPILHDAHVRVRVAGHVIGDWRVHAVPDAPPSIGFRGIPTRTEHDAVTFRFHGSDDYGVTGVRVLLTPHGRAGAPPLAVPLDGGGKSFDQTSYADLTAHPYAGLDVDARLEARDGAKQKTLSAPVTFRLPARVFTDPLARALIEQRQNLAAAPDAPARLAVAAMLDALTLAPEKFYADKRTAYMAIRAAMWGIRNARAPSDIAHVQELLWQTAVALERGGLLNAAEELRRLQALLNQAMMQGAPQEVIDQLLNRYNQAMKRYMDALAANPPPPGPPQSGESVTIGQGDIQNMMDMIQKLTQSGQRQEAARMLALLQNMLENLHMTQGGAGGGNGQGSPQNKALNDAMNKLGEMMGQQRGLLDKTFRQQQGQGSPQDGGTQGLSRQQQGLQGQLDQMLKGIDPKLSQQLRDGANAMNQSKDALQKGDLENARGAQQKALSALAKGAQALAQEAMKQSGAQGDGKDDPLGRSNGQDGKSKVKIPDASTLARARAILEELRRRAGEMGRPQEERDYIDRLLKSF